jgi:hypothetical protein
MVSQIEFIYCYTLLLVLSSLGLIVKLFNLNHIHPENLKNKKQIIDLNNTYSIMSHLRMAPGEGFEPSGPFGHKLS